MSETLDARELQVLPDQFKELLLSFAQEVIKLYQQHNFNINLIDSDIGLDSIKNSTDITMRIVNASRHAHPDELSARTTKERVRCLLYGFPLSCIPKCIIFGDMFDLTNNLNRLPRKNSIAE